MKQIIIGVLVGVGLMWAYMRTDSNSIAEITSSQLIEKELKNVSKLVVTEGYFSDIITYKDAKKYYSDWFTAEKKAVVLVKAKATLSYDLKGIDFVFDQEKKVITIKNIPEPELQISPSLQYYDLQQDYLNPFKASDYNKISELVDKRLKSQISNSEFISNGKNRLISELHALLSKGDFEGWRVVYKNNATPLLEKMD